MTRGRRSAFLIVYRKSAVRQRAPGGATAPPGRHPGSLVHGHARSPGQRLQIAEHECAGRGVRSIRPEGIWAASTCGVGPGRVSGGGGAAWQRSQELGGGPLEADHAVHDENEENTLDHDVRQLDDALRHVATPTREPEKLALVCVQPDSHIETTTIDQSIADRDTAPVETWLESNTKSDV